MSLLLQSISAQPRVNTVISSSTVVFIQLSPAPLYNNLLRSFMQLSEEQTTCVVLDSSSFIHSPHLVGNGLGFVVMGTNQVSPE